MRTCTSNSGPAIIGSASGSPLLIQLWGLMLHSNALFYGHKMMMSSPILRLRKKQKSHRDRSGEYSGWWWLEFGSSLRTGALWERCEKASCRNQLFHNFSGPFPPNGRTWLRHCDTSQKVRCSIPDWITGIFHHLNHFSCTMALGVDSLTEIRPRHIS
jgi:hypothetical protein